MPTFHRKPETVDARQFTGEHKADLNLLLWLQAHVGEGVRFRLDDSGPRKVLGIRYPTQYQVAYIGDWLVWHQHDYFEVVRPETMELEYEEV